MQSITKILTVIVSDAFDKCGYDSKLGTVTASDRLDLCQFQCNGAFAGAKLYKKAPFMIADDVAKVLQSEGIFSKVDVVKPGFLNLTLSDDYMLKLTKEIEADKFCGVPQAEKPQTIIIDYGGPNVAKPLHIGHLRSAIIGESLKRLARACGNTVYGDVHLGDWGLQIGLVIAELNERYPDRKCFSEDFNADTDTVEPLSAELLCEVYPFASKRARKMRISKLRLTQQHLNFRTAEQAISHSGRKYSVFPLQTLKTTIQSLMLILIIGTAKAMLTNISLSL